jgi:DNA polymerase III subunit delta
MQQKSNIPPQKNTLTYLITGEDEFKKRGYLHKLKSMLMAKGADEFNYSLYYAKDAKAADIIDFLETFSITGASKMAVIIEPEAFMVDDKKHLFLYMKKPRRDGVFLVMLGGKPSAKLDTLAKALPKDTARIDTTAGKTDDISAWVMEEFQERNKKISRRSASLISDNAKQDMGKAVSVIEQVSVFTGSRESVTDGDIMLFLDMPVESSTFLLLDAINDKKPDKAILILKELLRAESRPVQMIGFLAWHIIRFIQLKKMLLKGASRDDMLSKLRVNSYRLDRLISQARQFSLSRLRIDLKALADTDMLIKRSSVRDDYLLEALVVKLAS